MYKHVQIGWVILIALLCSIILVATILLSVSDLVRGEPFVLQINYAVIAILAACLFLFGTLTVTVDDEAVKIRFGIGLIRKTVPLAGIDSCKVVRNKWWYGWGIRFIRGGVLYNVSGLDAVEILLKNGRKCRIGTDEPGKLEEFINGKLNQPRS